MIKQDFSNLTGKILIASPYTMEGNVFHKSLIYVVHHGADGSVGFIVNRLIKDTPANYLFKKTDPKLENALSNLELYIGGPMDIERGTFLHSSDYKKNVLLPIGSSLAVSANFEILKDIEAGTGPKFYMFLLGHTAWKPGEMESEIENNLWIVAEADEALIFGPDNNDKWSAALANLGLDSSDFAPTIAHC